MANQIKPVAMTLLEDFWIIQHIPTDLLEILPEISPNPPNFSSGECYTLERKSAMNVNQEQFLWPEEEKLVHHLIKLQEFAFAWTEDEKRKFLSDYFNPVVISTVKHIPWSLKNIPIPPGIFFCIVEIIKGKLAAGIYKPSNFSYQSCWFCILKKDRKLLQLMHDLQSLNLVAIKDAGLPPMVEQYAKSFGGRGCYGVVTNFIQPYLHQFFYDSHSLNGYGKPLKRPFNRYQSYLEVISIGRDIRQINW